MDLPRQILGPKHREYFHEPSQILHMISYMMFCGDPYLSGTIIDNFKAGLIHLLQDEGYSGLAKIEGFLSDILKGRKKGLFEDLRKWGFKDIEEETIRKEVVDLIGRLDFGIYQNFQNGIVKFYPKTSEYFDLFLECSYSMGYDEKLAKKLERPWRRVHKNLKDLSSLMMSPP